MTDPFAFDSTAAFRAELRASLVARDSRAAVAPSLLADHEPLESLIRKLQRKIDEARATSGHTLYGLAVRRTTLVPPGEVWIIGDTDGELHDGGGYEFLRITRVAAYNPRDAAGYPSAVERWRQRTPGYTRHTLGAREAARDWRRHGPRTARR